jgi:glycosyltransferase involved in cell wall biosynthesis
VVEEGVSGMLVPSKDAEALNGAMQKLMLDKDLMQTFAINGRKRAEENFERSKMVGNIVTDLNEICGIE